jgi:FkbM family methyltransferase
LLKFLIDFARDVRAIGISSALQGAKTKSGHGTIQVGVPGIGDISVRRGDSDYKTLRQVFVFKHYEIGNDLQATVELRYRDIIASGKTPLIIDAGANIGLAALWFSRLYPKAVIVCVEPDPANFKVLSGNTSRLKNIRPLHAAIGSSPGSVDVSNETGLSWASVTTRSTTGSVPIVTINDIVRSVPNSALLVAKIDIEGFEEDLFSAALDWLSDVCAVFIEPHDWMKPHGRTSRTFQRAFGERSFGMFLSAEIIIYVNDRYLRAAQIEPPN